MTVAESGERSYPAGAVLPDQRDLEARSTLLLEDDPGRAANV